MTLYTLKLILTCVLVGVWAIVGILMAVGIAWSLREAKKDLRKRDNADWWKDED